MKPAPLPLWPPAKASSRLCNMELNRLNVLSFSPHSIEDFPSQIRWIKTITVHSIAGAIPPVVYLPAHPRAL
jgi:hypothetical protein